MFYAVVVLYNKKCAESTSLQTLMKTDEISVTVFDNSTIENENNTYCRDNDIVYYGFLKNMGLSYAYNYAIKRLDAKPNDIIIILDDDTQLGMNYFFALKNCSNRVDSDIFLPVVYAGEMILSPSNSAWGGISHRVKSLQELKKSEITAINSGMAIRFRVFQKIQYNENLFLDCVDHDFMNKVRENAFSISVIDCIIKQNYSRQEKITEEQFLNRFQIYKNDFKIYCRSRKIMWYYYLSIVYMKLGAATRYHKIDILWK